MGQNLGYFLSNTTHISSGVTFGKIFTPSFLMNFGGTVGSVVGGLVGGSYASYEANKIFGEYSNFSQVVETGVIGEAPLWAIGFLRWGFGR